MDLIPEDTSEHKENRVRREERPKGTRKEAKAWGMHARIKDAPRMDHEWSQVLVAQEWIGSLEDRVTRTLEKPWQVPGQVLAINVPSILRFDVPYEDWDLGPMERFQGLVRARKPGRVLCLLLVSETTPTQGTPSLGLSVQDTMRTNCTVLRCFWCCSPCNIVACSLEGSAADEPIDWCRASAARSQRHLESWKGQQGGARKREAGRDQ